MVAGKKTVNIYLTVQLLLVGMHARSSRTPEPSRRRRYMFAFVDCQITLIEKEDIEHKEAKLPVKRVPTYPKIWGRPSCPETEKGKVNGNFYQAVPIMMNNPFFRSCFSGAPIKHATVTSHLVLHPKAPFLLIQSNHVPCASPRTLDNDITLVFGKYTQVDPLPDSDFPDHFHEQMQRTRLCQGFGYFGDVQVQAQRNEDLEELRELGSGTFGTVYHGKWSGTYVAIKRVKKSCFVARSTKVHEGAQCVYI
ncbi:hypothetical protein CTI12_AA211870 [Artemisia annua]|uniref:Protein kinase domain-containing protein n=1 Tax=Artemisia annua TaxID=35608 RepID=A0A2U1NZ15_ARTAN|nr:hypothetical protein CTI12_AA211870 [Artemisia annua]